MQCVLSTGTIGHNEGRLTFPEMKIDEALFPVHTIDLKNSKVLIRPDQAEGAKEKNVVIGDPRPMNTNDKILAREVVAEETPDRKPTFRIFVNAPKPRG